MNLQTNVSELAAQSSDLKTAARRMEEILSQTAADLNSVGNVWESQAGAETIEMFNKLAGAFQKFIDAIMDRATTIDSIVEAYAGAESNVQNIAQQ